MYVYMYVSLVEHYRNVGRAEFSESSGTDFTIRLYQEILTEKRKKYQSAIEAVSLSQLFWWYKILNYKTWNLRGRTNKQFQNVGPDSWDGRNIQIWSRKSKDIWSGSKKYVETWVEKEKLLVEYSKQTKIWSISQNLQKMVETVKINRTWVEKIDNISKTLNGDVCMYLYMYLSIFVCMYVRMYVCMHACKFVCMYVCMYVYVCMY